MKRQKQTEPEPEPEPETENVKKILFPIPKDIVIELIEKFSSCNSCNFETGDYVNRKCRSCGKLICTDCDVFWSKCKGTRNVCEMTGLNSYRIVEEECTYMSGNKWCYQCVKKNKSDNRVCPRCHVQPSFILP